MTVFKKSKAPSAYDLGPGEWSVDQDGMVMVRCPHADHVDKRPRVGCIYFGKPCPQNWTIAGDGKVSPSVFFKDANRMFHDYIILEDWKS